MYNIHAVKTSIKLDIERIDKKSLLILKEELIQCVNDIKRKIEFSDSYIHKKKLEKINRNLFEAILEIKDMEEY